MYLGVDVQNCSYKQCNVFDTHSQEAAKDIISHVYNVHDNAEQKLLRTCYYSVVQIRHRGLYVHLLSYP